MYRVTVVDVLRTLPEEIERLPLWGKRSDLVLTDPVFQELDAFSAFHRMETNLVFLAANGRPADQIPLIGEIRRKHGGLRLILVGGDDSYAYVRKAFLSGAADYLAYPLSGETVDRTISRIRDRTVEEKFLSGIQPAAGFLAEKLLSREKSDIPCICLCLAEAVEKNAAESAVNAQILFREAKEYVYCELIGRKPWLEKFLPADLFLSPSGPQARGRVTVLQEWNRDFRGVRRMICKYRRIDAPPATPIGDYILTHVDEKLNLEKISKDVFLNKNYISNLFKKHAGLSVVDFIKGAKTDRAKVLLLDEKRTIREIADDLKFSDVEYFSKVFKQKTGLTPTQYRDRERICGFFGQLL